MVTYEYNEKVIYKFVFQKSFFFIYSNLLFFFFFRSKYIFYHCVDYYHIIKLWVFNLFIVWLKLKISKNVYRSSSAITKTFGHISMKRSIIYTVWQRWLYQIARFRFQCLVSISLRGRSKYKSLFKLSISVWWPKTNPLSCTFRILLLSSAIY